MKIGIPVVGGKLCTHFGHCEQFDIITVANRRITKKETLSPPPHAPGVIPNWLADQGVNIVLVGGMGAQAQNILTQRGVQVICGVPEEESATLVNRFLNGELQVTGNTCDHDHEVHSCGQH